MRFRLKILGFATLACSIVPPAYADSHGRPDVATQHAHVSPTTGKPIVSGKPMISGNPTITTKPTSTGKPSHAAGSMKASKSTSTTTATTHTTSTTSPRMLNPIAQKISSHPQLASKVHALLPAGTNLNRASAGFKNQGQFLAALHVSKNLGIPFSKLKRDMTGDRHLSLGQAIQAEKPRSNATTETRHAETEADDDLRTPATTTTSSTRKKDKEPTSPSSTTTSSARLNPIARKISSRPALAAKVQALLPAGMTLNQASKGFKNQGQFLAALHASKNLDIPFAQLRTEMTGKDHDSLGVAIQELKRGTNANAAVSTAEKEAASDVQTTARQAGSQQGDNDGDDL